MTETIAESPDSPAVPVEPSSRLSINSEADNSNTLRYTPSHSDFTVIWHQLTYKAATRRWYSAAKERFFSTNVQSGDGGSAEFVTPYSNNGLVRSKEKIILNQVCGDAKSRQLTAIMGPSGAGKSTLLHCLFQNRTVGTTGQILVESRSKSKLKVCFIPQQDYLNEWLTVREDLIFVSKLKLARISGLFREDSSDSSDQSGNNSYVKQVDGECKTSLIDHEANALRVSELLGLNNCLDVTIKNISGGQKKRLSIARELMSKPDILILDEPTTGLDSLTCYKTIKLLRDLSQLSHNPMAVIVTIHQPQREVFNLFDKTYFLSNAGRVIYDENPKLAVATIENVAQLKLPQPNYNPASFLIEIASDESQIGVRERLSIHQRAKFSERYDLPHIKRLMRSKSGHRNNHQNWNFCTVDAENPSNSSLAFISKSSSINDSLGSGTLKAQTADSTRIKMVRSNSADEASIDTNNYFISHQLSNCLSSHSSNLLQSFRHVFILTHRSWLSVIRNPTFTKSRLAFHTLLPLMMLIVYGNKFGSVNNCPKIDSQLSFQDMNKSIKDDIVAQNLEESRLSFENISFYFILLYGFGINIISCTASFYPLTMHMFKKETINGLYAPGPYFIGQMLAELPLELFFPSISIILSYQLSGQLSSFMEWRMFATAYAVFLVSYAIHSLGLLSGSIFVNNVSVAVLTGQALLLPFVMLSGFLMRTSRMPDWMYKLTSISPFRNGLLAVTAARYGFNSCECDEDMLPEDGQIGVSGMSPQVRHVLEYMFPQSNSTDGSASSDNVNITALFDQLGKKFVKAQTFGIDIKSCDEVRPYVMHAFQVEDSDLFFSVACLLVFIFLAKLITFSIMKSFPYRVN